MSFQHWTLFLFYLFILSLFFFLTTIKKLYFVKSIFNTTPKYSSTFCIIKSMQEKHTRCLKSKSSNEFHFLPEVISFWVWVAMYSKTSRNWNLVWSFVYPLSFIQPNTIWYDLFSWHKNYTKSDFEQSKKKLYTLRVGSCL